MEERRGHARYAVWFPVQIASGAGEEDTGEAVAVSKDVGAGGISISAATEFAVGVHVKVAFKVPPDTGEERHVEGTIVRLIVNPDDPHGLWPFRMAIAFDKPVEELDAVLRESSDGPLSER